QNDFTNNQYQATPTSLTTVHVTLPPVQSTATQQVPFTVPGGKLLTLSTQPQVNVSFDIYYDIAFDYDITTNAVTIDETSLKADEAQLQNASSPTLAVSDPNPHQSTVPAPATPMAVIVSATLPPGFSDTGTLNGKMPLTFADHGAAPGKVGATYFEGTFAV